MTAQYWSNKLVGGYAYHQGQYKRIGDMRTDIPAVHEKQPKFKFPEDYLPYLSFQLEGEDKFVKFNEFDIRFPDERYARINGLAVWGGRIMKRGWKILPSEETYKTSPIMDLKTWLGAPLTRFDKPESLFTLGKDCIFTPELAARDSGQRDGNGKTTQRNLFLCSTPLVSLKRSMNDELHIRTLTTIPKEVQELWNGELFDKTQPYIWPDGEKPEVNKERVKKISEEFIKPPGGMLFNFTWARCKETNLVYNWSYSTSTPRVLKVRYHGENYEFYALVDLVENQKLTKKAKYDVLVLMHRAGLVNRRLYHDDLHDLFLGVPPVQLRNNLDDQQEIPDRFQFAIGEEGQI